MFYWQVWRNIIVFWSAIWPSWLPSFNRLDTTWRQFNAVSEGDYAEQFRAGWIRTSDRFQEYIEQTQKISGVLDERVDHLRKLNKTEASLVG